MHFSGNGNYPPQIFRQVKWQIPRFYHPVSIATNWPIGSFDRDSLGVVGDIFALNAKTPCGNTLHGNREIPQPASEWVGEVRPGNPEGTRQGCMEVGSRTAPYYQRSPEQRSRCAVPRGGGGGKGVGQGEFG